MKEVIPVRRKHKKRIRLARFVVLLLFILIISGTIVVFGDNFSNREGSAISPGTVGSENTQSSIGPEPSPSSDQTVTPSHNKIFYNGTSEGKKVALTFDDGPDTIATPQILDILKENGIKATFFIVGTQAEAHPDMVRRIEEEGHAIGNHSWSHPHFDKMTTEEALQQIDDVQEQLKSIVGYYPSMVRPPYGALTKDEEKAIHEKGLDIVNWSVDTMDWSGASAKKIMELVHEELYSGGIILQHCFGGKDHLSNTIEALEQMIPDLQEQGYTFVSVPELLGIPDKL